MLYSFSYKVFIVKIISKIIVISFTEKGKQTTQMGNRIFLTQINLIILLIGGNITLGLLVLICYAIQRHWFLVMSNPNDFSSHVY